jgi:two-component system OmpR family response regulator
MNILLAEDDRDTAQFVREGLAERGHEVRWASTGTEAAGLGMSESFDAIVLDRMLPGLDGLEIVRRLRAAAIGVPVLMLTALGGIVDRVDGLEAGADDYLVKPFAMVELVARLNALARRAPIAEHGMVIEAGDIRLDLLKREATRGGRPIGLQPREFQLLEQLVRHAGRIVTRTMFLEKVWGFHFDPQTNIVESHLSRLRAKLRETSDHDPIETVRGSGYRLNPGN